MDLFRLPSLTLQASAVSAGAPGSAYMQVLLHRGRVTLPPIPNLPGSGTEMAWCSFLCMGLASEKEGEGCGTFLRAEVQLPTPPSPGR